MGVQREMCEMENVMHTARGTANIVARKVHLVLAPIQKVSVRPFLIGVIIYAS
jgi:hypothetical protein